MDTGQGGEGAVCEGREGEDDMTSNKNHGELVGLYGHYYSFSGNTHTHTHRPWRGKERASSSFFSPVGIMQRDVGTKRSFYQQRCQADRQAYKDKTNGFSLYLN